MTDRGYYWAAAVEVEGRTASYLDAEYAAVSSTPAWHDFVPHADPDRARK